LAANVGYPAPPAAVSGSPGDKRMLLLCLREGPAVRSEGTGDASRLSEDVRRGSSFSIVRVIRDPPRTPPSHERKHDKKAPRKRIVDPISVGRRYGLSWKIAT